MLNIETSAGADDQYTTIDITSPDETLPAVPLAKIPSTPLNALQQRALNGFNYLLGIKQNNLSANNYEVDQAAVSREEYREGLISVMRLSESTAKQITAELIQLGCLSGQGSFLYKGDGNQQTCHQVHEINHDYLPDDASARAFYQWLNEAYR